LVAAVEANAHPEYKHRLIDSPGKTLRTNAFGPEWPDQPYRLLATPAVLSAEASVLGAGSQQQGAIGQTRLFPHSANKLYDMPIRSTLPPTPETSGDWESMAYPAGEGVGAVRSTAPAAEIIAQMMSQAYDILGTEHPVPRPKVRSLLDVDEKPVLLFVHGAWLGSSSWVEVANQLSRAGWRVRTVDLPSVAAIGGPRFGLHDDAHAVRQAIKEIDGSVVVVAHSYGGAVATEGAADLHNVRHVFYIAGFQLDIGESVIGSTGNQNPDWWNVDGDTMLPDQPQEIFFNDLPRDQADRAAVMLKPFSMTGVTETLSAAVWHNVPSTYLLCERDHAIPLAAQEMMATRATNIRRLPSGHSPFLSMPTELTHLIVEAATEACTPLAHLPPIQGAPVVPQYPRACQPATLTGGTPHDCPPPIRTADWRSAGPCPRYYVSAI